MVLLLLLFFILLARCYIIHSADIVISPSHFCFTFQHLQSFKSTTIGFVFYFAKISEYKLNQQEQYFFLFFVFYSLVYNLKATIIKNKNNLTYWVTQYINCKIFFLELRLLIRYSLFLLFVFSFDSKFFFFYILMSLKIPI